MKTLRLILGDQLNSEHSWYKQINPATIYALIEMRQETDYVLHHAQKVIAIFAAMREFGRQLSEAGHTVHYLTIDHPKNVQTLAGNLDRLLEHYGCRQLQYQEPDEWRRERAAR